MEIRKLSKRNIGSVPRSWRRKGPHLTNRSLRSSSSRSEGSRNHNNLGDNIFFRPYRDDEESNVYVDLRTEALMRDLG